MRFPAIVESTIDRPPMFTTPPPSAAGWLADPGNAVFCMIVLSLIDVNALVELTIAPAAPEALRAITSICS